MVYSFSPLAEHFESILTPEYASLFEKPNTIDYFAWEVLQKNHLLDYLSSIDKLEEVSRNPALETEEIKNTLALLYGSNSELYNSQLRIILEQLEQAGVDQEVLNRIKPQQVPFKQKKRELNEVLDYEGIRLDNIVKRRLETIKQNIVKLHTASGDNEKLRQSILSAGERIKADVKEVIETLSKGLSEIIVTDGHKLASTLAQLVEEENVPQGLVEKALMSSVQKISLQLQSCLMLVRIAHQFEMEKSRETLLKNAEKGCGIAMFLHGLCFSKLGKKEEALHWLRKAVDQGHGEAMALLAVKYFKGEGIERNEEKAYALFKKSAEVNNPNGIRWLSLFYLKGFVVEKDYAKACELITKSIEAGDASGPKCLGYCYAHGFGVEENLEKAFHCFERGFIRNDEDCFFEMADMLEKGKGVERDLRRALKYYDQAAIHGEVKGFYRAGRIRLIDKELYDMERAAQDFKHAAEAGDREGEFWYGYFLEIFRRNSSSARVWYQKSAAQKNPKAFLALGEMYERESNIKKALSYYTAAIEIGDTTSLHKAGRIFLFEEGFKDYEKAEKYLQAAAEKENPLGQLFYGQFFEHVKKDKEKTFFWVQKAVDQGNREALHYMAKLIEHEDPDKSLALERQSADQGYVEALYFAACTLLTNEKYKDVEAGLAYLRRGAEEGFRPCQLEYGRYFVAQEDYTQAREWLRKAADKNSKEAMYALAMLYLSGQGGKQDTGIAKKLLKRSSKLGYEPAKSKLDEL